MIGDKIKELRKENKMTQEELAKRLNIKQGSLSNYETNRRVPDAETLNRLADLFKTSVDYIMGRYDNVKRG